MELSQEQSKAAMTGSTKALCLAGAGSGKTRVLVSRIQALIENHQVSPYEITAITFTRKAAGEMKKRLQETIGNKAYNITIGTIHGVALNMLQRFGELIGLNPGRITIYSGWEEEVLLKDVCQELGYHNGKSWKGIKKKEIAQAFQSFYADGSVEDVGEFIQKTALLNVMNAFLVRCKENNALTYGMILTNFLDLLPKISDMLNIRHILLDEVQDQDKLQWAIVDRICELCEASLFAVGDDSQSIFSFRGADPEYLIRHQNEFDVYKLEDNYRSDANIVTAANKLILNNESRLDLSMNAKRKNTNEVLRMSNIDSDGILKGIQDMPDEYKGNVAVLARNHYMLVKLSRLLKEAGIDHEYIGKKTAFTRSENFSRVHAFLKLAVNPFDNFSFFLIKDYLYVTIDDYLDIRMKAAKEDKSHFQVWCENPAGDDNLTQYIELVKEEDFTGILTWIWGVDFDFDPDPVFKFIAEYQEAHYEPTIEGYLAWLAIYDVQDEITQEPKKLQLLTIHASKGLEWETVIIAGMNEGILPSNRAADNQEELESERRLAYVAYTRARDSLVLTVRPPADKYGNIKYPISRFVGESLKT